MENTNTNATPGLAKGTEVLWIQVYPSMDGATCVLCYAPVRIESWGKKQGTALRLDKAHMAHVRFYTNRGNMGFTDNPYPQFVANLQEAEQVLARVGPDYAERARAGFLRSIENNFANLRPQYRAKAEADMAHLRALQGKAKLEMRPMY